MSSFFVYLSVLAEIVLSYALGRLSGKKLLIKITEEQKKAFDASVKEMRENYDKSIKEFEFKFETLTEHNPSFPKRFGQRLKEAVSQIARAKAKSASLETSLRAARLEITKLNAALEAFKTGSQNTPQTFLTAPAAQDFDKENSRQETILQQKISELTEMLQQLSEQNRVLRTKNIDLSGLLAEARQKSDLYSNVAPAAETKPAAKQEPTATPLSNELSVSWRLNGQLTTVPLPKTLTEMKSWADTYLTGKVILTKKALQAANDVIDYRNVTLVYKSLLLLTTRCDMHAEGGANGSKKYFDEKLRELNLECSPAITTTARGTLKKAGQYICEWNGRPYNLDMALKRGNSRDPRRILRVYFTYDEGSKKIIVGHLPTHLENNLT